MNDPAFQRVKVWLTQETGHIAVDSEEFIYTQVQDANPDAWAGFQALISYFGGIGVLVHRGLLDLDLVYDLLSSHVMTVWERFEPGYKLSFETTTKAGNRYEKAITWWKYLYDAMKQYEADRGMESKSMWSDTEQAIKHYKKRRKIIAEVKARVASTG